MVNQKVSPKEFILILRFLGLFGYVQNRKKNKALRVLGVDARAPGVATDRSNQVSHRTSMSFLTADLKNSQQPFYYHHYRADGSQQKGMWPICNDDLEIQVNGQPLPKGKLQYKDDEETGFSLIPTMFDFYPELNGLSVKDSCFVNQDPSTCGLSMRMQLMSGFVGIYPGENGEYISNEEYQLAPYPNKVSKRLANCLEYQAVIKGSQVEIYSQQLGSSFIFQPSNGHSVEITFSNVPPEGLEMAKPFNPEKDTDFELIYSLAQITPVQLRVPTKNLISAEFPSPMPCGCVLFNPSELA